MVRRFRWSNSFNFHGCNYSWNVFCFLKLCCWWRTRKSIAAVLHASLVTPLLPLLLLHINLLILSQWHINHRLISIIISCFGSKHLLLLPFSHLPALILLKIEKLVILWAKVVFKLAGFGNRREERTVLLRRREAILPLLVALTVVNGREVVANAAEFSEVRIIIVIMLLMHEYLPFLKVK